MLIGGDFTVTNELRAANYGCDVMYGGDGDCTRNYMIGGSHATNQMYGGDDGATNFMYGGGGNQHAFYDKLIDKQTELNDLKAEAAKDELSDAERVLRLRQEVVDAVAEEKRLKNDVGPNPLAILEAEKKRVELQRELLALTKTYAVRMAAVFMMSLATIWLKTGLMQRWLVFTTYGSAIGLLLSSDLSMWIALVFPAWVLLVSVLALVRSGGIDLRHDDPPR